MAELEKVKKGLHQHCEGSLFDRCGECPYYEMDFGSWEESKFKCRDELLSDALELLKEDCHNCKLECLLQKYDELKEKYDALLKKQEAVEPSTYHHLFICPVCKTTLKREQKFCHECGKPIEWEGSVK